VVGALNKLMTQKPPTINTDLSTDYHDITYYYVFLNGVKSIKQKHTNQWIIWNVFTLQLSKHYERK